MKTKQEKREETRALLMLAGPLLLEQILRSLIGTVNTFMLSRISDQASAAVGVSNQILNVVIIAATMLASGTAVVVNQYLGAGKNREAAHITMNSLTFSTAVGAVLSVFVILKARWLLALMGLQSELVGPASVYLRIVGVSCTIQFISIMAATHFRCRKKPKTPMLIVVFTNVINLLGCMAVISRVLPGPFQDVQGIALVRLISESLGLGLILVLLAAQGWDLRLRELWQLKREYIGKIVKLGFMTGAEGISYTTAQLVATGFITSLPSQVLSAKVYVQTVNNYTYMAGLAVGQAAQIMTGHLIGAGRKEEAYCFIRKSWVYVFACNLFFSLLFWLCSGPIIGIFTDSTEIAAIASGLFLIDILTCMGRSLNHSFNYGLRSAGYVFWPMIIASSSIWLVQTAGGWLLTCVCGLGITGLWLAQAADEWLRGLCVLFMWQKKRWMKINITKQ